MTTGRAAVPLRQPEASQRATFLELFFDLAFVFALFQLSHVLLHQLSWSGALQTTVLLLAVWANWTSTIWIADRLDPRWPPLQALVFATLLVTLVLSAVLPEAFGRYGAIFAGVYVAIEIGRYLFVVLSFRGHELQRISQRGLVWASLYSLPWIAGAFVHGSARAAVWLLAIAIENAVYVLGFPSPRSRRVWSWEPPVAAEHFAERYRQVFIIGLGELILVSGLSFSDAGVAPDATVAFVVSACIAGLLWRIYIYRAGELLSAAFAAVPTATPLGVWVVYVHLAMVGGIVVTAVGNELVIAHPSGRTPVAWAVVILGGPALYVAGRAGFEYTVFARVSRDRLVGALVLVALIPVALLAAPLLSAIAAAAVLTGTVIVDAARARRKPAEPPSPPTGGPPTRTRMDR
jgi:low temperature requirement protein LtrA